MGSSSERSRGRWQMAKLAKLASLSLALIASDAAAAPMNMRIGKRVMAVTQAPLQTQTMGLNRLHAEGMQLNTLSEEPVQLQTPNAADGSATSAKDQLAQRLVLQQESAHAVSANTDKKRNTKSQKKQASQARMLRRLEIAAGVLDDGDDVAFDSIDYKMYQKDKRAADVDVAPEPQFSIAQSLDSAVQESARLATESRVPPYVSTTKHSHSYTRMREPESAGMGGFMQFEYLTAGVYTFESHSAVYADPSSQDKVSVELKTPRQVVGGAEIPFPGADNTILTSKTITKDGPVHKTLIAGFTLTDLPAATYTIPYYSQQIVGSMERQTKIQTQEPKKLSSDRYSSLLDVAPVKRAATSASDNESGAKNSLEAGAKASLESGAKAKASSNFESGAKASLSSTVSSESCGNVIFTDQLNEEEKAVRPIAFSATATAAGSSRDTAKATSNYTQSPGAMRRDTRRADANLVSSAPPPPRASLPKAMQDAMQDASTSVSLPEVAPAILQPEPRRGAAQGVNTQGADSVQPRFDFAAFLTVPVPVPVPVPATVPAASVPAVAEQRLASTSVALVPQAVPEEHNHSDDAIPTDCDSVDSLYDYPSEDYIKWLRTRFNEALSFEQTNRTTTNKTLDTPQPTAVPTTPTTLPDAAPTTAPTTAPSTTPSTTPTPNSQSQAPSEELRKELAVVRVRVQETEAQVKALQQQLQDRHEASREASRLLRDQLSQKLQDFMAASSTSSMSTSMSSAPWSWSSYSDQADQAAAVAKTTPSTFEAALAAAVAASASAAVAKKTETAKNRPNENVPARKLPAVPVQVRRAETWGAVSTPKKAKGGKKLLAADGIFGVRLLAAITEASLALPASHTQLEKREKGGGSGVSYQLGSEYTDSYSQYNELSRLHNPLAMLQHFSTLVSTPIPSQPHADPSQVNTAPAHKSTGSDRASQHDAYHGEGRGKYRFASLNGRERTAQRIRRTAKSTMRAAGAAVSKLWVAAGKALSEEARCVEDDAAHLNTFESQHLTDDAVGAEEDMPHSNWRNYLPLFARFRSFSKGTHQEPTVSAEEEAFAKFFEQACRERGGAECSQDATTAYAIMQESRRQHVHLLEANLWGGLLAKRLEMARSSPHSTHSSGVAVWVPGKWAGVFVQDAYTEMDMQLEITDLFPDGTCAGLITWAHGHSVTAFEGDVRGNQMSFEEVRVLSDYSGGRMVPGTRYRLWKDDGDGPDMEGTWLHPQLSVWGYLNLKSVVNALACTEQSASDCTSSEDPHDPITPHPKTVRPATGTLAEASHAQQYTERHWRDAPQEVSQATPFDMCLGCVCVLMLTVLLLPKATKLALRQWNARQYAYARAAWVRVRSQRVTGSTRSDRKAHKCSNTPHIDIPAEAFRAAGRSVLRNSSSSSVSSPLSSDMCSSTTSSRAHQMLLSSSVLSSSPSCSHPLASYLYSMDDMQSSREEEEEPVVELSSVLELENIRMSLSQSHSTTLDTAGEASEALQLNASLNASWVMHDEADSVIVSEELPCKEVKESGKPAARDVLNVCALLSKIPRISDSSAAPTEMAGERRHSDTSDRDRRISLGWLAVEDALAASVSELTDSFEDNL